MKSNWQPYILQYLKSASIVVEIKINNRKILSALAKLCSGGDKMTDITVAIDKLDKIGLEKVKEELGQKGLNEKAKPVIDNYLSISGSNQEKLSKAKELLGGIQSGKRRNRRNRNDSLVSHFTSYD